MSRTALPLRVCLFRIPDWLTDKLTDWLWQRMNVWLAFGGDKSCILGDRLRENEARLFTDWLTGLNCMCLFLPRLLDWLLLHVWFSVYLCSSFFLLLSTSFYFLLYLLLHSSLLTSFSDYVSINLSTFLSLSLPNYLPSFFLYHSFFLTKPSLHCVNTSIKSWDQR